MLPLSLRPLVPVLLGLALLASCRGAGEPGRVLVLGLDGLDPRVIDLLMSEGKLPHFAEMRSQGAYAPLRSMKPLLSPIIWTTIATGRTPDQHGIGHFVARSATGEELPVTSQMRRVEALWTIASDQGRDVATVGWWATWPPEQVRGSVVSDHVAYHFLFEEGMNPEAAEAESGPGGAKTYPPDLEERIAPFLRTPRDLGADDLAGFVEVPGEELARAFDFENDLDHFRWALATGQSYRDIGLELWRSDEPDLELVYIEGVDSTSHLFGHLFRTEDLGGELAAQQQRFGDTVEQMYLFADRLVGEYLEVLGDDTTLVVLSDHGFELGALHDDPKRARDLRRVSEKFHREEGILYLYGRGVKTGARLQEPTILDITPTVLTLLGIAPSKEMPGRVLEEGFVGVEAPERIASWEKEGGRDASATGDARISQAQLDHLRSLGYLGGDGGGATEHSSPQGDRNLAAIHFQQGDYRAAAKLYYQLIEKQPDDGSLRASLAGALGALERYEEALEQLDKAIELEPLNVEAYHNRAVIHERSGRLEAAAADYERALRYGPSYEPSLAAYQRLTGHSNPRAPRNDAQRRAAELADQASAAARRGHYDEALEILEQAAELAPDYVLVYQYRSNVGYLMDAPEVAAEALEKALELEPDNVLFQRNLEQVRRQMYGAGAPAPR
ncbi:MAG: alkaline phosphatase family protein [Thermoanaerobaculia bacterium]|nr:alkaline phosphatase family protein [Thermoanaerobaculia bacterium]